MDSPKIIKLVSSDNQVFEVPLDVIKLSITIKNMYEDSGEESNEIPIPNINNSILKKIITYCEYRKANPLPEPPVKEDWEKEIEKKEKTPLNEWEQEFLNIDMSEMYELILAANYLDIKCLLDRTCQRVANSLEGKSVEEMRQYLHIKNDFTPEEEQKVIAENEWVEK